MDISKTLFATMVKNARMDRHWTQEELAEKLSVSRRFRAPQRYSKPVIVL